MSFAGLILSVVFLIVLAVVQFIFAVASGSGLANGGALSQTQLSVLNASLIGLPALSVLTALGMGALYWADSRYQSPWWNVLPVAATLVYAAYAVGLSK